MNVEHSGRIDATFPAVVFAARRALVAFGYCEVEHRGGGSRYTILRGWGMQRGVLIRLDHPGPGQSTAVQLRAVGRWASDPPTTYDIARAMLELHEIFDIVRAGCINPNRPSLA